MKISLAEGAGYTIGFATTTAMGLMLMEVNNFCMDEDELVIKPSKSQFEPCTTLVFSRGLPPRLERVSVWGNDVI
jgi:hypothetical protein